MRSGYVLIALFAVIYINTVNVSIAKDYIYKNSITQLQQDLESCNQLGSILERDLNNNKVYIVNSGDHYDPKIRNSKSKMVMPVSRKDAAEYIGSAVFDYCLENGISPNSREALEYGASILNDLKKSDKDNRIYIQKLLREVRMLEASLQERISSRRQENREQNNINDANVSSESYFSCKNNENEEGGCCCFNASHTYMFKKRQVFEIVALFDTGKKIDCRSTVKYEVHVDGNWKTVGSTQVVSSRGNETYAPNKVSIPVNRVIDGFRLGDGCRCCIDFSEIWLQ